MGVWQRFWAWVTVDWRSWLAHPLICLAVAVALSAGFRGPRHIWWVVALGLMMLFYLHREIFGDRAKYKKAGTWEQHRADGFGDGIGAVCLFIGALGTLILSHC